MDTATLILNIRKWNPYCEHITLATIFAKMKEGKGRNHVINHGPAGTGKSRSTLELVKALDLGTEIILDNTTTDKGLFQTFQEYPEQDIVLDECSTLLKSLRTQDMVKTAMEGKPLTWTTNEGSETTEPYKGNLIVNANVPMADTVIDRSIMNKSVMNKEMSLAFNEMYIEGYMKKTDYSPFIKHLKQVLTKCKIVDLTNDEVKYVLGFVQTRIKDLDQPDGYSRRIIIRELNYFQRAKTLFGSLNKEVLAFIEPFAETYIGNASTPGLIESILGNGPIEKPRLVKRVAREGGYTEQHARRIVAREIELGRIILKGKMIEQGKL